MNSRKVSRVVASIRTQEGAGFSVRRPFPTRGLDHLDPFLLLDEMGPMELAPGQAKGAPDHPHRGFETVTYMLAGQMEHQDSAGNRGTIGPGDVQWMTAGAGVVHAEMPGEEILAKGGRMHGFQLWVNLPRVDKMMKPRYQEVPAARIPVVTSPDGTVTATVIAGEAMGVSAVIDTRTPILYVHYRMAAGAQMLQAVPESYNVFAYLVEGSGHFGSEPARSAQSGDLVMFGNEGEGIAVTAEGPLDLLVIGGRPLAEPVARYGPFVMNSQDEIMQAIEDFRAGRLGAAAKGG